MMKLGKIFLHSLAVLLLTLPIKPTEASIPPKLTSEGFLIPQPGAKLSFPRDHASHPGFKIEWWYLTGHLFASTGERYGYQATFFRSALEPGQDDSSHTFNNKQLYLTHMALTDLSEKSFHFEKRLSREGWDAFAETSRLEVRNGNWSLIANPDVSVLQLQASVHSDVQWSLELVPEKELIRFGEDGTSIKGPSPQARSYYLTFTRMRTTGFVTIDGKRLEVSGSSWMDHEIASNQLDPSYSGWDWIAIQLNDGWEIKAYLLRDKDGNPSAYSSLIWIDPEGETYYRKKDAFQWSKSSTWRSPATNAEYPNMPKIRTTHPITGQEIEYAFIPLIPDQELVLSGTTYWEGAGKILTSDGNEVGSAYLELVGYAGSIRGL